MGKKRKIRAAGTRFGRKHAQHPISKRLRALARASESRPTPVVVAVPVVEPPAPPELEPLPEPAPVVEVAPEPPVVEPVVEAPPKPTRKQRDPRKRATAAKTEE